MNKCKHFLSVLVVFLVSAACSRQPLRKEGWDKCDRAILNALIEEAAQSEKKTYAVFDFDGTLFEGSPEVTAMAWQIENLHFRMTPEVVWNVLVGCIPDIDKPLSLGGLSGVSSRMLATDIMNDYIWLYDNYIQNQNGDLESIRGSEQYQDFRAKLWALSAGVDETFGYETGCLWPLRLYHGMTMEEVQDMVRKSASEALSSKGKGDEEWKSPAMGECGEVTVSVQRGLSLRKGMANLCKALSDNGVAVYVCSASCEEVVEAVACDPSFGIGLEEEDVYGVRLAGGGRIGLAAYDAAYPQPFLEGKVETIRRFMSPAHGGAGPILVAGDSEGDHAMLTAFPDIRVGLLVAPSSERLLGLSSGKAAAKKAARQGLPSGEALYIVQK